MKKQVRFLIIAVGAIASMAGCNRGKTTRIVTAHDNFRQEIKYSGKVVFNRDSTDVAHISNHGYLYFDEDGRKLRAENDGHDKIIYSFNGNSFVDHLSFEQKDFVAHAVKVIIRERAKLNR